MAIAVAEPSGALVYFLKMDDTQYASIKLAIAKAETAAKYRRPTKMFTDGARRRPSVLPDLRGDLCAAPGGLPLVADGKLIGAIGVSGGSRQSGRIVAEAGVAALTCTRRVQRGELGIQVNRPGSWRLWQSCAQRGVSAAMKRAKSCGEPMRWLPRSAARVRFALPASGGCR